MYQTYKGCVHIHSTYSDGSSTPEEIAAIAREANLDFAIITDHNTLSALADGKEGWYDSVLLLIGVELSLEAGHYLAFDVPYDLEWRRSDVQGSIDNVNASGGFGMLSHPISRWPWKDWSVDRYTGMELTNLNSLVAKEGKARPGGLLFDFLRDCFLDSSRAMRRVMSVASDGSLEKWAEMLRDKRVVGIGGADAHASLNLGIGRLRIPSYLDIFKSIQVNVLVTEPFNGDFSHDKALVYKAVREGRCYTVFAVWDNDVSFEFTAGCSDRLVTMGDSITQDEGPVMLKVDVDCNKKVILKVYRNRKLLLSTHSHNIVVPAPRSGAYRLEIDLHTAGKQVPWVITNPIYVE